MRPLRYVYVLALALWLGGIAFAGLVVAPTTFGVLETWDPGIGRVLAGRVFGSVLARLSLVGYAAGALMIAVLTVRRVLGPRPRHYGVRVILISAMLALTGVSAMALAPRIDRLQLAVGQPMSQLTSDDPRRVEFDTLHRWSTALVMSTLVGALLLLAWESGE
ncbi:MAG: DUF4149 domain-containing protein [Acidobacteriota bacterium]